MNTENRLVELGAYPSELTARSLLDDVKNFRREWAGFAVKSQSVLNAFRDDGASLPEDFLDGIGGLESAKCSLVAKIVSLTSPVDPADWKCPDASSSLKDFERSLNELLDHCRERDERLKRQNREYLTVLEQVRKLRCSDRALVESINGVMHAAKELATRISGGINRSDRTFSQDLEPFRSLLVLVSDHGTGAHGSQALPGGPDTTLDVLNSCFATVGEQFGQTIAIGALTGRICHSDHLTQISPSSLDATERRTENATPEQLQQLVQRFNSPPAEPVRVRERDTSAGTTNRAVIDESVYDVLRSWADKLRTRSLEVRSDSAKSDGGRDTVASAGYVNLAKALELTHTIVVARSGVVSRYRNELHDALRLLAEAQSAVRVHRSATQPTQGAVPEQDSVFFWLKNFTDERVEAFPIDRYMRLSENAVPARHADLSVRIDSLQQRWNRSRQADDLIESIGTTVQLISQTPEVARWQHLDALVSHFVSNGRKANDPELREILEPLAAAFADGVSVDDESLSELSREMQDAMQSVYLHIEEQSHRDCESISREKAPPAHVQQALALVQGKKVAIVGGTPKPEARARIEAAFQLKELVWIPASKKDRVSDLEPLVCETSLVILITSLIGHKHNAIRKICSEYGIPWVQTKKSAGYGVNQLAAAIISQASNHLERSRFAG